MNSKIKFFLAFVALGVTCGFSDDLKFDKKLYDAGSKVFDSKCMTCHIKKDYSFDELGKLYGRE